MVVQYGRVDVIARLAACSGWTRGPWSLNREKNNDWPGPSKSGADWLTSPKARAARNFFIGPRRSESRRSSEVQRFESLRREAQPPPFRSAGERSRSSELQQYRVKHRRAQAAAVSGKHRRARAAGVSGEPRRACFSIGFTLLGVAHSGCVTAHGVRF